MTNLTDLLKQPWIVDEMEPVWRRLTEKDNLYRALNEAVQQKKVGGNPLDLIKKWKIFADNNNYSSQWDKAVYLVQTAVNASNSGRLAGDLSSTLTINGKNPGWEKVFINLFRGYELNQLSVPVVRKDSVSEGLFTLKLSLLSSGSGELGPHPADVYASEADEEFEQAMKNAWQAARSLAIEEKKDVSEYDGCWRVFDRNEQAVSALRGASAGGAAAIGWLRLFRLHESAAYDGIIVMASINASGKLGQVDSVGEKTLAVLESRRIDTIIVADAANENEVRKVLREQKEDGRVKVKRVASLKEAVAVQSQLVNELAYYCRRVKQLLDPIKTWRKVNGDTVRISKIAVKRRVVKVGWWGESNPSESGTEIENDDAPSSNGSERNGKPSENKAASATIEIDEDSLEPIKLILPEKPLARNEPQVREAIDPYQLELYEESEGNYPDELDWTKVFPPPNGELILLRGGPGYGKTVHTRYEIITAADLLLNQIENGDIILDGKVRIPVWLPLVKFAESTSTDVVENIVHTVTGNLSLKPLLYFPDFLKRNLMNSALIFFDGFDELDPKQTASVIDKFQAMRDWTSYRYVTCRPGDYRVTELAQTGTEYNLAPFRGNWSLRNKSKEYDIEQFIKNWFADDIPKAERLIDILKQNFALHNHCRSPLLLTFTCLKHQNSDVAKTTTLVDLFRYAIDKLLRESRRDDASIPEVGFKAFGVNDEVSQIDFAWRMLPEFSFNLFNVGISRNHFTSAEIRAAMNAAEIKPENLFSAIEWLKKKGLLVFAGTENNITYYSFAHRTLLEFLVAQHLVSLPNYLEIVERNVTDTERNNVRASCFILPLLVGFLSNATPIIELLVDLIENDAYEENRETYSLTLLNCLLECNKTLSPELLEKVFEILVIGIDMAHFALKNEGWNTLSSYDRLARILAAAERHYEFSQETRVSRDFIEDLIHRNSQQGEKGYLQWKLQSLKKLENLTPPERWLLLLASVQLEKENSTQYVIKSLADQNSAVRALAARALARIGKNAEEDIISHLMNVLYHDVSDYTKSKVIGALSNIKIKPAARPAIISLIKEYALPESGAPRILRNSAMFALANFKDKELLEVFRSALDDESDSVQSSAISGLALLKDKSEFSKFVEKLKNASISTKVRRSAAWALGQLKLPKAIPILKEGMTDENHEVALMCYQQISRYGIADTKEVIQDLLFSANNIQKKRLVHIWHMAARQEAKDRKLGQLTERQFKHLKAMAELCLSLVRDSDTSVCQTTCGALSSLMRIPELRGDGSLKSQVIKEFVELLSHPSEAIRKNALYFLQRLAGVRIRFGNTHTEQIIHKCLEIISGVSKPQNKVAACQLLADFAAQPPFYLNKNRWVVEKIINTAVDLLDSPSPELKVRALGVITDYLPLVDFKNRFTLYKKIAEIYLLMMKDDSLDLRVKAITSFGGIIFDLIRNTPSFADKLQKAAIKLVDDPQAEISAASFWILSEIVRIGNRNQHYQIRFGFLEDDNWIKNLTAKIQVAMSDDSPESVVTYALRTLRFLLQKPVLQNDPQLILWLGQRCLALANDYDTLNLKGQVLILLNGILMHPALRDNRAFQKDVAHICLAILLETAQDTEESNLHSFVQIPGIKMLENLLTTSLTDEKQLIQETLEHCILLTENPNEKIIAPALRFCEIAMQKEVFHDSIVKRLMEQILKHIDHPASTVRATTLGVFIKCAPVIREDPNLTSLLFNKSLNCLKDSNKDVVSSALMLLEGLIVHSNLSFDKKSCHDLANHCLALIRSKKHDGIQITALRALEKILIQPAIKENSHIGNLAVTVCLNLFKDPNTDVRYCACSVIRHISESDLPVLADNRDLVLKVIRTYLNGFDKSDSQLKASIIFLLSSLIRRRWGLLESQKLLLQNIFRLTLKCLMFQESDLIATRANHLLSILINGQDSIIDLKSKQDANLAGFVYNSNSKFLAWDKFDKKTKKNALISLRWFVINAPSIDFADKAANNFAGVCLKILKDSQFPNLSLAACKLLLALAQSKTRVILDNYDLCYEIAKQSLVFVEDENEQLKKTASFLLVLMTRAKILDLGNNDELLSGIAGKFLAGLEETNKTPNINLINLLGNLLKEHPAFFRSNPVLLQNILQQSISVLRNHKYTLLGAAVSRVIKILYRSFNHVIADKDETVRELAEIALEMMLFAESADISWYGCKLLTIFIQSREPIVLDNYKLCREIAKQSEIIVENDNGILKDQASYLLYQMKKQGFQLVE
jgi:HEAT repeat protein